MPLQRQHGLARHVAGSFTNHLRCASWRQFALSCRQRRGGDAAWGIKLPDNPNNARNREEYKAVQSQKEALHFSFSDAFGSSSEVFTRPNVAQMEEPPSRAEYDRQKLAGRRLRKSARLIGIATEPSQQIATDAHTHTPSSAAAFPNDLAQGRYLSDRRTTAKRLPKAGRAIGNTLNPKSTPNSIGIFLDGKPESFSPILLRDLCTCQSCLDPSTKQKLFSTADIPADIKTNAVAQDASSISIVWENDLPGYDEGHATVLDLDTLRALRDLEGAPSANSYYSPGKQSIWDASQYRQLEDFDYESYMNDAETLFRALQQLHAYGMLFVRNVPDSETSVSTLGERIGPIKNTFYGYTWDVRSVPEAKNVAYTSQDLGFHMDLLYMHQPPHLQLLHCIRSSAAGGASLFADSYKAAADLLSEDISAFIELATLPASFHYDHPDTHLYQQSHVTIQVRPDFDERFKNFAEFAQIYRQTISGAVNSERAMEVAHDLTTRNIKIEDFISHIAWSPPFQAPFRDPTYKQRNPNLTRLSALNDKVTRWHSAAAKFNRLIHREHGMYERMMRPGECVVFDNRRVLHARRAFDVGDAGKERWLRGTYLDWDPYMSKMRVLGRKFGLPEQGSLPIV